MTDDTDTRTKGRPHWLVKVVVTAVVGTIFALLAWWAQGKMSEPSPPPNDRPLPAPNEPAPDPKNPKG